MVQIDSRNLKKEKEPKFEKEYSAVVQKRGESLEKLKKQIGVRKNKDATSTAPFKHRGEKKRATDKVKEALPVTPEKRAAVLSAVLESPTTRQTLTLHGLILSPEEQKQSEINQAIVKDARSLITSLKDGRSKDSRAAMQCCTSLLCGETVTEKKIQKHVAETLSINRERVRKSMQHRKRVLSDALSDA